MIKAWGSLIIILFFQQLFTTSALAGNCKELVKDLQAMRSAQKAIITSLADNHQKFAQSFDDIKFELDIKSDRINKKTLKAMGKTADLFRIRGEKAQQQADKLDLATAELISEIEFCLR